METNFPDTDTGFPTASMAEWVFQQLKLFAAEKGKLAQIFADDGSSWTYKKLLENSVRVAVGLKSMGINSGDMVSFLCRNTHELYAVVFGCFMSGVIVAPSLPELHPHELKENLLIVKPKSVIAGAPYISAVEEAITALNPKPQVFEIQQLFQDTTAKGALSDPTTFQPVRSPDPRCHVFACLFSSGTTGKQKAIAITDYGFLRSLFLASRFQTKDAALAVCNPSQINWISWFFVVIRTLFKGWTRIFMDKSTAVNVLDAIHKFRPVVLFGPPRLAANIVLELDENPGRWDLSSITTFFMGGDICNKLAHEVFTKKLKVNVYQEYGSTESAVVLQSKVEDPVIHGSVGKPLVPLKLVDPQTGKEITEPNKPGEIVVKWMAFRNYVNNPEATADALDENGWLKMGDVAIFDESGNYFMVDRIKEMFKYLGFQIAPSELEDIIRQIPGVKDAAVAGKHAGIEIGYIPTAFVVKFPGSNISEKDIHAYLERENLHDSKRLRGGVIFTDKIPRNANGKIERVKLRALLNNS